MDILVSIILPHPIQSNFNFYSYDVLLFPIQNKAVQIVKLLSESHWTSSCIITMGRFQHICGGADEASAVLSYLSRQGKAQHILVKKGDIIQVVHTVYFSSMLVSSFIHEIGLHLLIL